MQMEILCKQIDGIKVGSGDYQSLIGKETPDDGYGRHYRQATITPPLFQMCPRRGGGGAMHYSYSGYAGNGGCGLAQGALAVLLQMPLLCKSEHVCENIAKYMPLLHASS